MKVCMKLHFIAVGVLLATFSMIEPVLSDEALNLADWLLEHCLVEVPEWLPPEKIEELETTARREAHLDTLLDF